MDIFFSLVIMHPYLEVYGLNFLVSARYKNCRMNASTFASKFLLAEQPSQTMFRIDVRQKWVEGFV